MGDHNGFGLQFIPEEVQVLGTVGAPVEAFSPLVYLNGMFGSDPNSLSLHKTWFWPQGRPTFVSLKRFADGDPFSPTDGLGWPPASAVITKNVFVSADIAYGFDWFGRSMSDNLSTFDGSQNKPFPDPDLAQSFVAPGGTINIKSGIYKGWFVPHDPNGNTGPAFNFSRSVTIIAVDGPVILGSGSAF